MNSVNTDDFCYMWRGKIQGNLAPECADRVTSMSVTRTGNERALIMLHGFSSCPAQFRLMVPELTEYDAIFCPALPGHGSNYLEFSQVKASDWLAAVEQLCTETLKQYAAVDLFGLSLGGVLACHLAAMFPIHRLYLLAPALKLSYPLRLFLPYTRWLMRLGMRRITNRSGNLCSAKHSELGYRKLPLQTIIELNTFINHFNFTPPACPIDVFLGRHDPVVDNLSIASQLNGLPETHIHWLEHSAHLLTLDNDVNQIINCLNAA